MVVPSTGAEGHHFVARLPFSWEIKEMFDMTLDTYIGDEKGKYLKTNIAMPMLTLCVSV